MTTIEQWRRLLARKADILSSIRMSCLCSRAGDGIPGETRDCIECGREEAFFCADCGYVVCDDCAVVIAHDAQKAARG